ncbi:MAG: glycosyltransferase family 39 protein [Candidatus Kerfeldbacteria bacterium]|nr:glycosyltransferase family 39 protein [Candidatus Kerfeldbacteria bacterium]
MTKRWPALIAALLLLTATTFAIASMRGDSAIVDEKSHLPAGVSYVTRGDLRLNPEHPPLIKDLAGFAVVAWSWMSNTPIRFPATHPSWAHATNDQWSFGPFFLYEANGQAVDAMLFWGRLPTLLVFVGFGWWFFVWVRRRYGGWTGLLAVSLYALSPTVLAHARYITTDLGAAAAFFIATLVFLRWLKHPNARRLVLAGAVFGGALLVKFSVLILIPIWAVLIVLWAGVTERGASAQRLLARILGQLGAYALILTIAFGLVVLPVYVAQTWNYPAEKQAVDARAYFQPSGPDPLERFVLWSADKPVIRAAGQYLTGVLLVANRAAYGSVTYFQGTVKNGGRTRYFPLVYLVKEPLAFHLLSFFTIIGAVMVMFRQRLRGALPWARAHFTELSFLIVVGTYWIVSIQSALNIGVRHLLPTLPFAFVLVSIAVVSGIQRLRGRFRGAAVVALLLLLGWQAVSVLRSAPSFLAYFNEAASGSANGHRIVADSNLDWGQDLKRLAAFVRERGIDAISVDYFGGGNVEHALPDVGRAVHIDGTAVTGWLAVSQTYLTAERGQAAPGYDKAPNRYAWLDAYEPATTVGHSIVVYNIPASP